MDRGTAPDTTGAPPGRPEDEWTWPPGGPLPQAGGTRWATDDWAPPSTVRRPLVRVGRWTLVYRRPGG